MNSIVIKIHDAEIILDDLKVKDLLAWLEENIAFVSEIKKTLSHIPACGEQFGGVLCTKKEGHDGAHKGAWCSFPQLKSVSWFYEL